LPHKVLTTDGKKSQIKTKIVEVEFIIERAGTNEKNHGIKKSREYEHTCVF